MRTRQAKYRIGGRAAAAALFALVSAGLAFGQASERAAFVAHNHNLSGSVSSFVFDELGQPVLVDNEPTPSTNAYSISLSPNGRFLAVTHATAADVFEDLDIIEVAADATLNRVRTVPVDDSPLCVRWITDDLLAVTRTSLSVTNQVVVYQFDEEEATLTEIDRKNTLGFTTNMAVHPSRQYLYAQCTGPNTIHCFRVEADGTLTEIEAQSTGSWYPLGMTVTNDGTKLYAGGGISGTGREIVGAAVNPDGSLTMLAGSPYTSPGQSPKAVSAASDDAYVFVAHGTDATVRSFAVDEETGDLTYTGHMFDVGFQGTLGVAVVLDELLLVTDNSTIFDGLMGLYAFTIHPDGSFTQNGPIVDTGAVVPQEVAVWSPPAAPDCPGDLNGDGMVGLGDLSILLEHFGGPGGPSEGDLDGDGMVGLSDLSALLEVFGTKCD